MPSFTAETRIATALAARPELRDLLPAFHPAFARLNHPVLGKVLPRIATIRDAARVVGVDEALLLDVFNLPGPPGRLPTPPVAAPLASTAPPSAPPDWLHDAVELDVRPLLDAGTDPFATILARLRTLPEGRPLTVLAPFEPAPLVRILEKSGWLSFLRHDGDTVRASFWRAPGAVDAEGGAEAPVRVEHTPEGARLDVRGLEPPEPMRRILVAVSDPANLPLRVLHHREPVLLYPRLTERGLRWTVTPTADGVELRIDAGA